MKNDEEKKIEADGMVYGEKSVVKQAAEDFQRSLDDFPRFLCNMSLKKKDLNTILAASVELIHSFKKVNQIWMTENQSPNQAIEITSDMAINHLSKFKSTYKRNKMVESDCRFVRPVEKSIGTRWELKKSKDRNGRVIQIPRLIQCTLQYVSILDTLRSLPEDFWELYFEFNKDNQSYFQVETVVADDKYTYSSFRCGTSYRKNSFFQENPDALQLQISADEFEICNPLQSKSNIHKICGVYFTIHNLPTSCHSKLNNIFLLCLCNSDDLKSKQTDYNNIWQLIVDEVKILEECGIKVNARNLKGTLVHMILDNAGANVGLGFAGSFSAVKNCRNCLTTKNECRVLTSESDCVLRTIENYENSLDVINESEKVDYNESNGIKFYCVISNLNAFHIVSNPTVDSMHDINEGCIPETLKHFFKFCFKSKIFSAHELDDLVKFHDFGVLNRSNVPSQINLDKRSLGQNASQSMCLFVNLPFILYDYKEDRRLQSAWNCIKSLLRICEILHSYEITEKDLKELSRLTTLYLELFKETFGSYLIPKMHFLLHYASVIIGPSIYYNMMRFEAKHKVFKTLRNATNNFKSINKTLAYEHQKQMFRNGFCLDDQINHGVLKPLEDQSVLQVLGFSEFNRFPKAFEAKFLHFNNYKYVKNLIIVYLSLFYEIDRIVFISNEVYFVCQPYKTVCFNKFLHSFQVEKDLSKDFIAIKFADLKHKKSYEMKILAENHYVICQTLDLHKQLNK